MKALPFILLGLVIAIAAAAFFVPAKVYVDAAKTVSSIFTGKKVAAPKPQLHVAPSAAPMLTSEALSISPQVIDTTNKLIDTVKNGLGTLATLVSVLLGFKQLQPVREKQKAKKAAKRAKKLEEPEPQKKVGLRVTSRPKR